MDMFKEILGRLKEKIVRQEEYKDLNRKYNSTREELINTLEKNDQLTKNKETLESEIAKEKDL